MVETMFWGFGFLLVATALLVVFTRRLVQALFLLLGVLLCVAALMVFAGAEFLAAAQLILYVGGILIVLLFGLMLTGREAGMPQPRTGVVNAAAGLLMGSVLFGGIAWGLLRWAPAGWGQPMAEAAPSPLSNPQAIGVALMSRHLLPFEAVSVLLLLALVGAAFLARR